MDISNDTVYISKLTIEEVLDTETGEIISSADFFKQPEAILFAFKEIQEYAINGLGKPKFVCVFCNQIVKILGKKTERGKVSFFSHLKDSDACIIKTNNSLTRDEILIGKFQGQKESERHIDLKNKIYHALNKDNSKKNGITEVEIEKTIKSKYPILNWRRPDISAQYQDKKIVFELQLSTIFFSVIIARDIFYNLQDTFVIWIFNFSDNQEYVNLDSMMCKNIYYANRRNAFIFDKEAQLKSEEENQLILKCIWFEPIVENNIIINNKKNERLVKLSDIIFNSNSLKAYYKDADKLYFNFDPLQEEIRKKLELDKKLWIENFKAKLTLLEENKSLDYNAVLNLLKENKLSLLPVKKGGKYGYIADSVQIVDYIYSDAGYINEKGITYVKREKKYGFINNCGLEIIPCEYSDFLFFVDDLGMVKYGKDWYLINNENTIQKRFKFSRFNILNNKFIEYIAPKETLYGKYGDFVKEYRYGIIDYKGNVIIAPNFLKVSILFFKNLQEIKSFLLLDSFKVMVGYLFYFNHNGQKLISVQYRKKIQVNYFDVSINNKWGFMDLDGVIIIDILYDLPLGSLKEINILSKNGLSGVIDNTGFVIIDFKYNNITFENDKLRVVQNNLIGYSNKLGVIIIPCIYEEIEIKDNLYKCKLNNKWGYLNNKGDIIIPLEYEIILDFKENIANAKKNSLWGYIDNNGAEIIPFNFQEIDKYDSIIKVKNNNLFGYINKFGEILIPISYESILMGRDNLFKVGKNKKFGYVDITNKVIIPIKYNSISDFDYNNIHIDNKDKSLILSGLARYIINNKKGYLDLNGDEYWIKW